MEQEKMYKFLSLVTELKEGRNEIDELLDVYKNAVNFDYDCDLVNKEIDNYGTDRKVEEIEKFLQEEKNNKLDDMETKKRQASYYLKKLNEFLSFESDILENIENQKETLEYDENKKIKYYKTHNEMFEFTYKDFLEMFEYAKSVLDTNTLELLSNFNYKYEMISNIAKNVFYRANATEYEQKLKQILTDKTPGLDDVVIIKTYDERQNTKTGSSIIISAGTRRELLISNLIGKPYPKEGKKILSVDSFGDPSFCFVTHTVYEPITQNHIELIEKKKKEMDEIRNKYLSNPENYKEVGDLLGDFYNCFVDKASLMKVGIDPQVVGWKPHNRTIVDLPKSKIEDKVLDDSNKDQKEINEKDIIKATGSVKFSMINSIKKIFNVKEKESEKENGTKNR